MPEYVWTNNGLTLLHTYTYHTPTAIHYGSSTREKCPGQNIIFQEKECFQNQILWHAFNPTAHYPSALTLAELMSNTALGLDNRQLWQGMARCLRMVKICDTTPCIDTTVFRTCSMYMLLQHVYVITAFTCTCCFL